MPRQYKNYSDEDIRSAVASSTSMSSTLKALGLAAAGGNYANMKRKLQQLEVDTSHWKGHAWNKGQSVKPIEDYRNPDALKNALIRERGYRCQACGFFEWRGEPVYLHLIYNDGDSSSRIPENLRLVCGNCKSIEKSNIESDED